MKTLCSRMAVCVCLLVLAQPGFSAEPSPDGLAQSRKAEAYLRQAREARLKRDWDNAEKYYLKSLDISPDDGQVLTELAWVYNETKRYEEAARLSFDAMQLDEGNAVAWRELGYALLGKKEFDLAEKILTEAIKLAPNDPASYEYRAAARKGLGLEATAREDREKAKELREKKAKPSPNDVF
jgi:tetratricopeptide (TPR) repeat protein